MNVCVIPARGGSKRIPRKNIRDFCGQPMMAWSIQAAQQAGCFDRIIVSTDDQEIAKIAINYGAQIPFLRPREVSNDTATTRDVIVHSLDWLNELKIKCDALCCIYATAPFVRSEEILRGRELLELCDDKTFVYTATSFPFPVQRAIRINPEGASSMLYPEHVNTRSQDLEEAYHDAGQFYWGRPTAWSSRNSLFDNGKPMILPRWRVQDIDTEEDWHRAEMLYKVLEEADMARAEVDHARKSSS